ncbi:trans-1,2-dihydrobenzene-1,2-diol dehydrogenase [Cricetulus griseus]|nr:trans-1,2-dihydrobenzene-1,2-diol dehydrogenase [Cricetulus griseus]
MATDWSQGSGSLLDLGIYCQFLSLVFGVLKLEKISAMENIHETESDNALKTKENQGHAEHKKPGAKVHTKGTLDPYPPREEETPATPTRRKDEKRTRRVKYTVGGTTPGLVLLGYKRKQTEQAKRSKPVNHISDGFYLSSCLQVPALSSFPDFPSC